jgi:hypothetical protein
LHYDEIINTTLDGKRAPCYVPVHQQYLRTIFTLFQQPGKQGNSTYFLCAKIPLKSNTFEEKNNRDEPPVRRIGRTKDTSSADSSFLTSTFANAIRLCG